MRSPGSKKNLASANDLEKRKAMFDPKDKRLSVMRQADLLSVNRSSLYPAREPAAPKRHVYDVAIMNRIDEIYTSRPYYGYRRIHVKLIEEGWRINIKKTRRLMRDMGLYAIYPKRNLSKMYLRQYIHPYLLRNLKIERPNQVWGCDLTYIRLGQSKGFMYLFAIIDLYSRLIVDYELSATLEKEFVLRCLTRAFQTARPEILNSDQGSHFTNDAYVSLLKSHGIQISMNSKGRALDNIFMERFFRSLKYENIYLNEYVNPRALRKGINQYITFYNYERPHQSLDYQPPIVFYRQLSTNDKPA